MDKASVESCIRRATQSLEKEHGMTRGEVEVEVLRIMRENWAHLDAKWQESFERMATMDLDQS